MLSFIIFFRNFKSTKYYRFKWYFSKDNSYESIKDDIKSNDSRFTEDNDFGLIGDLSKEYIESSLLFSSIHDNKTTNFFSKINIFENNIEIPLLKRNKIFIIEKMFYGCFSLVLISDISNWNTYNVNDMISMFSYCNSLISLSDISNWIFLILMIWVVCLVIVIHLYLYLIYQIGIFLM